MKGGLEQKKRDWAMGCKGTTERTAQDIFAVFGRVEGFPEGI